jgi:hypothetical protein
VIGSKGVWKRYKKIKKTRRSFSTTNQLYRPLNLVGTQTSGTYANPFGSTAHYGFYGTDISLPTTMGLNIRVADQIAGLKVLATNRTTIGQEKHLPKLLTIQTNNILSYCSSSFKEKLSIDAGFFPGFFLEGIYEKNRE